uniref:Slingshot protein phosphatase 1 n=1 Tax=Oncorhynchus mykiss TaxID=8022 RepID=A0A8C7RQ15_ONCMY
MELTITLLNGDSHPLTVQPHTTLGSLKSLINQHFGVAMERQRLSGVNGNNISLSDDSKTLSDYGLHSGSKVMVLITEPTHIQVFLKNEKGQTHTYEVVSGLSLEGLHPLELPETPSSGAREGTCPVEGRFSAFPGDFPKSSTPCPVRLEPLVVPLPNETLLGAVGSGGLTPTSSPHGSTLTRSSSSDSIRSVRGKPGLVRQRAQEIETRMRLAGLTVPSSLKRSNSLAKLGSLNFSSEDLCSICSSDAGTLLLRSLSPEPGREWECPTTSTSSSTSTFTSTHPRAQRDQTSPERALPGGARS